MSSSARNLIASIRAPGAVLLDTQRARSGNRRSYLFHSPARVLAAHRIDEVKEVLREAERLASSGKTLAGFLAYEAAAAFGLATASPETDAPPAVPIPNQPPSGGSPLPRLSGRGESAQIFEPARFSALPAGRLQPTIPNAGKPLADDRPPTRLPLVWFGVYDRAVELREEDWSVLSEVSPPSILNAGFNVSSRDYRRGVERVRDLIAAGDTYQVNLTCKYRFDFASPEGADPFAFYRHLRRAHPVAYGAYLNLGETQILSFSPELFLMRKGDRLVARPMKGTIARGLDAAQDEELRRRLRASEKDRAENVMIVDLMRNDLGRVCETGSIRVPRLFVCETLGSVHQMTSTVEGRVRAGVGFAAILEAAFPCGSVTGAPKYRTMQIIRDLEGEPRGPYCGAIGRLGPGKDFLFNVAIRTLVHRAGRCELGVGSGITWSSDPEREWDETVLKTRFLEAPAREFALFETLLLRSDGSYAYLREHVARLARSARYWGWRFPRARVLAALEESAGAMSQKGLPRISRIHTNGEDDSLSVDSCRFVPFVGDSDLVRDPAIVRLEIDRDGAVDVKTRPLADLHPPIRVMLSPVRVDQGDPLVYHKTSRRDPYDAALAEAKKHHCAEAILSNRSGHLTEGSFTNLLVQIDGQWFTPPIADGLLDGIWRRDFMRRHSVPRAKARERSLAPDDLRAAERIVVGNSVRGGIEVGEILDEQGTIFWGKPGNKSDG